MIRIRTGTCVLIGSSSLAVLVPLYGLKPENSPVSAASRLTTTRLPRLTTPALQGTMLEAPLFTPERVPLLIEEAETAEAIAAVPAAPPTLVGTVSRRRGAAVALVKNAAGETLTARIGDDVDGWSVVAIGNGTVVIDQKGRRETVALDFSNRNLGPPTLVMPSDDTDSSMPQPSAAVSPNIPQAMAPPSLADRSPRPGVRQ